jgi:transposase
MSGRREVLLTDEQWEKVRRFIPKVEHPKGGRPRTDDRSCFEGILWVLKSIARWKDLPERFPFPSTCWRRLVEWDEAGVFLEIWHAFIDELNEQGRMSWDELFIEGSLAPAKKGAKTLEKPSVERVQSGWWWLMAREYLWHAPRIRPKGLRSNSHRKP